MSEIDIHVTKIEEVVEIDVQPNIIEVNVTKQIGENGNGISSITLVTTVGYTKNYRINFTDGSHFDYSVTDGTNGTNGSVWRNGSGVPNNSLGVNGDYYLDTATSNVYFKTSGTYSIVANIKGADGDSAAPLNLTEVQDGYTITKSDTANYLLNNDVGVAVSNIDIDFDSAFAKDDVISLTKIVETADEGAILNINAIWTLGNAPEFYFGVGYNTMVSSGDTALVVNAGDVVTFRFYSAWQVIVSIIPKESTTGVTEITAEEPIIVTGGDTSTPHLSMNQANTTTGGYLSGTDWNTFNNKQNSLGYTPENTANKSTSTADSASSVKFPVWSAIVSYFSVSQIRSILGITTLSGNNTGDETNTTIKTKLGSASSSQDGYLTSSDWTTFNNKQAGNSNLTTIAGLTPSANDLLQYKSGAWTNRTPAQVKTDLAITAADVSGACRIIAKNTGNASITGTTSETILESFQINAGTLASIDNIQTKVRYRKTGTNGTSAVKIYINTTNSLSGATQIAQNSTANTNLWVLIERSFSIYGGNLYGYPFTLNVLSDVTGAPIALSSTSLNVASNFFIIVTGQLGNSSDTMILDLFRTTN